MELVINKELFAKEAKKALIDMDMTQLALAQQLGINSKQLGHILTARRAPGIHTHRIMEALGLTEEMLCSSLLQRPSCFSIV